MGFPLTRSTYLDYAAVDGAGYAVESCDELALYVGSFPLKFTGKLMIDEGDVLGYAFSLVARDPCAALVALHS